MFANSMVLFRFAAAPLPIVFQAIMEKHRDAKRKKGTAKINETVAVIQRRLDAFKADSHKRREAFQTEIGDKLRNLQSELMESKKGVNQIVTRFQEEVPLPCTVHYPLHSPTSIIMRARRPPIPSPQCRRSAPIASRRTAVHTAPTAVHALLTAPQSIMPPPLPLPLPWHIDPAPARAHPCPCRIPATPFLMPGTLQQVKESLGLLQSMTEQVSSMSQEYEADWPSKLKSDEEHALRELKHEVEEQIHNIDKGLQDVSKDSRTYKMLGQFLEKALGE